MKRVELNPSKIKLNPKSFLVLVDSKIGRESVQTVDARLLWKWLESKRRFADWIKVRIEEGQFEDNKDFVTVHKKMKRDIINNLATNLIEYHISLDMAKHLAMMERNDKGKLARQYFIQCEKEALKHERVVVQDNPFNLEDLGLGLLQVGYEQRQAQKQVRNRWVNILRNTIGCGNIWVRRLTNEVYQILLDSPTATAQNFRQHMNLPLISSHLTRDQLEGHVQSFVTDIELSAIRVYSLDRDITFTEIREFIHKQAQTYHQMLLKLIQQPVNLVFQHDYNIVPMLPYRQRRTQVALG